MSNLNDMRGKLNSLATEMHKLWEVSERSADEESRLDQVIAEFNDLGPAIQKEEARSKAVEAASAMRKPMGSAARSIPVAGAEEAEKAAREYKTLGQRFAASDQVEHFRQYGGKRSDPMSVGSFYHTASADMEHRGEMTPQELRALVYTGAFPNSYIAPQMVNGVFRGDDLQGTVRDVLINGQTNSDAITFFRETSFTNNAAAVAEASATTGATGLKPESALALEEATAAVKTIAHWIPITRQTLDDAPQMQTYVEGRLLDGLRLEESDQLLNGDGTGANMLGITNHTGVQALDDVVTTGYFSVNPVNGAGTDRENFDRILRAKSLIRTVGRARADFVVLNPADSEVIMTATTTDGNYYGAGPFSGNGVPPLWGLRVVEDENQAAGEALVGDGRMAAVWDRMQSKILIDTINDQFVRNMLTILAEERLALTVFRPQAFALVALA